MDLNQRINHAKKDQFNTAAFELNVAMMREALYSTGGEDSRYAALIAGLHRSLGCIQQIERAGQRLDINDPRRLLVQDRINKAKNQVEKFEDELHAMLEARIARRVI